MRVPITTEWIRYLGDYINENKIAVDDLRSLPFIPLSHPKDTHISAESSSSTFAIECPTAALPDHANLRKALMQLDGFHIISQWTALPPDLIQKPEPFNISLFSRWLGAHESSWTSLDQTTMQTLAKQVKSQFRIDQYRATTLTSSSPLARLPVSMVVHGLISIESFTWSDMGMSASRRNCDSRKCGRYSYTSQSDNPLRYSVSKLDGGLSLHRRTLPCSGSKLYL